MNTKIIGIVVAGIIIVAVIAVVIFGTSVFATPYWETENEFGIWQDEIIIEFADGTTESLKIIQEGRSRPFTVKYDGKEITYIGIKLRAKPEGSGYDGAELKYEDSFGALRSIKNAAGNTLYSASSTLPDGTTKKIAFGNSAAILQSGINIEEKTDADPALYPTGTYTVSFEPIGEVWYRGYPDIGIDNPWKTASLPPSRSISVTVEQPITGQIVVTLTSGVETS